MSEEVTPPVPERPLLHGDRVWLRPLEGRDLPAYVAGINDTEVGRFAGFRVPLTVELATIWHARTVEMLRTGEGYYFAVCELGDDRFIGTVWFKEVNRIDQSAELSIYMDKDHIGSGWGSDAQRTLLTFGFGTLGLERVWLVATAGNTRAIRSYEKIGFQHEGLMRRSFRVAGRMEDQVLMAILREEWEAKAAGGA